VLLKPSIPIGCGGRPLTPISDAPLGPVSGKIYYLEIPARCGRAS
jgi:hypothetical protein